MEAVIWSQVFADEESRDALFQWLCIRVDRWAAWGKKTGHMGAPHFNALLVTLLATDMSAPLHAELPAG